MWLGVQGRVSLKRGGEIPGQEFLYTADRMVGDVGQDRAEIEFRARPFSFADPMRL